MSLALKSVGSLTAEREVLPECQATLSENAPT